MGRGMMVVMGVFDSLRGAEHAVAGLKAIGVSKEEIVVLAHPRAIPEIPSATTGRVLAPRSGVGLTTAGLVLTLVGIGLCAVPLAGLLTAGPLIVGGGLASVAGRSSPLDDLRELGVPKEDAEIAIESARRGGIALIVRVERPLARRSALTLARAGAVDFHKRAAQWEAEGWVFAPNAPAVP